MSTRIEQDHARFRNVIKGRLYKSLQKLISKGHIFPLRGKNGQIAIPIDKIDIPHFIHGENDSGVGRGKGKKGDLIQKGKPDGGDAQAGNQHKDGMKVIVPLEDVIKFLKEELELPDLRPKEQDIFENREIKYRSISKNGPESLRHNRRTLREALKRTIASGEHNQLQIVPGCKDPLPLILPDEGDKRYRQWKEIDKPSCNAVIMFGRDGSGSMDDYKCQIVSDMCWWIDAWIRHFYKKVERCYYWHDTVCEEVDEEKFYSHRYGGGTYCSSCPKMMVTEFDNRFPPQRWNVYCFYFSDGDNWDGDNSAFVDTIKSFFPPEKVNLFAITQILCNHYKSSLKQYCDENLKMTNVRTVSIGEEKDTYSDDRLTIDERNDEIKKAIKLLLGRSMELNGFEF